MPAITKSHSRATVNTKMNLITIKSWLNNSVGLGCASGNVCVPFMKFVSLKLTACLELLVHLNCFAYWCVLKDHNRKVFIQQTMILWHFRFVKYFLNSSHPTFVDFYCNGVITHDWLNEISRTDLYTERGKSLYCYGLKLFIHSLRADSSRITDSIILNLPPWI